MNLRTLPVTDHTMKDQHLQGLRSFPIQYYVDELECLPGRQIGLHWHPELEFYVVRGCPLRIQLGQTTLMLQEGDGVFLNVNFLHAYSPGADGKSVHPNIVFSPSLIAPFGSTAFIQYIQPILENPELPYILLNRRTNWQADVLDLLDRIFSLLQRYGSPSPHYGPFPILPFDHEKLLSPCYELDVQLLVGQIWRAIYENLPNIPKISLKNSTHTAQIRIQQMMRYVQENFPYRIALSDIARSAGISKSEAARCFAACMNQSPGRYLLECRIKAACEMLSQGYATIAEIAEQCGFSSSSYFCKIFRRETGLTPLEYRSQKKTT